MKVIIHIIFRVYTRWNWHRFLTGMVAVASRGQSLRHS